MNKINWVSCEDRLPEINKDCLIITNINGTIKVSINFLSQYGDDGDVETDWEFYDGGEVTYWCYLEDIPHPNNSEPDKCPNCNSSESNNRIISCERCGKTICYKCSGGLGMTSFCGECYSEMSLANKLTI